MNREVVYLAADVAFRFAAAGLPTRTPDAVRAAVRRGDLDPDKITAGPVPVYVWSELAFLRDFERTQRRQEALRRLGRQRGRRVPPEVQTELALDTPPQEERR